MSEQIKAALPKATLTILPKVRHLTPIECPEKIAELLKELLKKA
jgi:3-oxoadipate enol-lactonase